MIREYIDELLLENNEELENLEKQLKDLLDHLEDSQKWMETLQAEHNIDTSIFSPRISDTELVSKIEHVQEDINKTRQDIEYVRSFIETHVKKKQEYRKLLEELDRMEDSEQKSEENSKAGESLSRQFLSELYKKTEICLALLNSDRNRCKTELRNMQSMIRNAAAQENSAGT